MPFRMIVRHAVADYDTWRKLYDTIHSSPNEHMPLKGKGLLHSEASRSIPNGDRTYMTIIHDFDTAENMKAFTKVVHGAEFRSKLEEQGTVDLNTIQVFLDEKVA